MAAKREKCRSFSFCCFFNIFMILLGSLFLLDFSHLLSFLVMLASSIQNIKASVLRRRPLGSVPGWRSIFALSPNVDCNNRVTEPISNEEFQEMMSRCNLKKSDPNVFEFF